MFIIIYKKMVEAKGTMKVAAQDDDFGVLIRREHAGNGAFSGQFPLLPVYFPPEPVVETHGTWKQ
jgi:hypothetical protein